MLARLVLHSKVSGTPYTLKLNRFMYGNVATSKGPMEEIKVL